MSRMCHPRSAFGDLANLRWLLDDVALAERLP